jgi:peptidoglycan-associated lipoprotein
MGFLTGVKLMNVLKFSVLVLIAAMSLNGCSSKGGAKGKGADDPNAAVDLDDVNGPVIGKYKDGQSGDEFGSGAEGQYGSGGEAGAEGGMYGGASSGNVVYFGFDSSEILPESVSVVNSQAGHLAADPNGSVVLEGHADERGSSEYNIALGERRAKAVAKLMKLQGAGENQMQIVSYGEEKPADPGHNEAAYQKNRRVEFSH